MQLSAIQRILGLLLALFSTTMVPPMLVSEIYDDGAMQPFIAAFMLILGIGLALWLPVRHSKRDLRLRDGFLIVVMFWVALGLSGSVPLLLSEQPSMSLADAVFESVSGLTTTGATVATGIDTLPPSILFYRQQLQWLGGMGIIVLAVAILPMLGVGGMQLYRAETPGPLKDTKLTPRITETAKALWYIYVTLTAVCAGAYWLAGMNPFDAVCHAFSTVAIGGFSTHDASLGYFDNPLIEAVAVVFMTISAVNFALHFTAWRNRGGSGIRTRQRAPRVRQPTVVPMPGHQCLPVPERYVPKRTHGSALRGVPGSFDQHHDWIHDLRIRYVAELPAGSVAVRKLCRRVRGIDRRGSEGD